MVENGGAGGQRTIMKPHNHSETSEFGPAIGEAAEPRCATPSAIKPPDTPRWSEARPR
jgi:hypothetical protein